jgi:hypothetical protein
MERTQLLNHVMSNYRRFYIRKAFLGYPWVWSKERRSYLLGCLKAFLKSGFERKFYDLGRVKYWGPQSLKKVDCFDIAWKKRGRGSQRILAGKNNHDTWDCEILLRTCSALHELPHGPAFLGGRGCEAV